MKGRKERVIMMIKVLFIAPYPAMAVLIDECKADAEDLDVTVKTGNLGSAVPLAKRAEQDGFDVIISRGGTAKLIEEVTNLPVIDIHVSGYDMLRVLTLANEFPGKKAIVGFSNITLGAETITDILEFPIEVFTVEKAEEVGPLIKDLKDQGYSVIMGDVVTVHNADRYGMEGILIQSGREAIFDAFQRTRTIYSFYQKKQTEIDLMKAMLKTAATDLVVLDSAGGVVYEQWNSISPSIIDISTLLHAEDGGLNSHGVITVSDVMYKVKPSVLTNGGRKYYLYSFSKVERSMDESLIKVEHVSQLPLIIQESEQMKNCISSIEANIKKSKWALIGENGTGKGLIARYIHYMKHGGEGLFAVAVARDFLKKSEVDEDIKTIYLQGIEALDFPEQQRLQQVADYHCSIGINILFSVQSDSEGVFDTDVARIYLPPLRKRNGDIRALAAYLIADSNQRFGTSPIKIKEEALDLLEKYHWPGNVAELKAVLQDAAAAEKGYVLSTELIGPLMESKISSELSIPEDFLQGTLEEIEKKIIRKVMEHEDGNQTRVANRLNINRSTLWRKLKN
ncbi:sigma-54-dependent transcriptional regulator [Mesobacillus selenatarsenatis]|uniref:Propionate catabolism operon regulatory protein PrpR n=1 Tax=Mesobacillus selenatarsenatis (strain DSM 18680 / JCM 14380 / FERM P-15431 / SF-1) TaxID=1321606 RepID=A0A0A8XAE3_MESS1|nr:sigma-54-dependent transcriptional regulator [Mesobacillus selenatarsenatis]GAM16254.1 propionate catabolism operon regulatory protein PrpR [Mesobacillus selenatarsenatis SF-1]